MIISASCAWRLPALLAVLSVAVMSPARAEFQLDGDVSLRYDDTSQNDERSQYRMRAEAGYAFGPALSLHTFIATGTDYSSTYNTIDENDDEIHVRRLFLRYENDLGKLELGTIPTYKGRVSSTGLSENGWFKGLRGVLRHESGVWEIVLGELGDRSAQRALSPAQELNLIELEYARQLTEHWSYELGFEHMLDDEFLRVELRHESGDDVVYSVEAIHNTSANAGKFVAGMERTFNLGALPIDWYIYYAYAETGFGPRAALTEDFLDFGHALANEFSGAIADTDRLSWFLKAEVYESQIRGQLGVQITFQ
ncbi:MAG: hypothetical protein KJO31_11930 [Gammaproteobacteria bacterium]|nr:hypothetical protein [Gammaproteobacteria bacterium]